MRSRRFYIISSAAIIIALVAFGTAYRLYTVNSREPRVDYQTGGGFLSIMSSGKEHLSEKEYKKAIADFSQCIQLLPNNAEAYYYRGLSHQRNMDYEKAKADFDEAIRLAPKMSKAYCARGESYRLLGDFDKALADYNEAIRLAPEVGDNFVDRARVQLEKQDYDKAIADCTEAIRLNPNDPRAHLELAKIRTNSPFKKYRNAKEAVTLAKKAKDLSGESSIWIVQDALITLANAYAESGDFDSAVFELRKLLEDKSLNGKFRELLEMQVTLYQSRSPRPAPTK